VLQGESLPALRPRDDAPGRGIAQEGERLLPAFRDWRRDETADLAAAIDPISDDAPAVVDRLGERVRRRRILLQPTIMLSVQSAKHY